MLLAVGVALLAMCALAIVGGQDVLAGSLAVLALFAFIVAVLEPRMRGKVSAGLQGFEFELVEAVVRQGTTGGLSADELSRAVINAIERGRAMDASTATPVADAPGEGQPPARSAEGEISPFGEVEIERLAGDLVREARRDPYEGL